MILFEAGQLPVEQLNHFLAWLDEHILLENPCLETRLMKWFLTTGNVSILFLEYGLILKKVKSLRRNEER